MAKLVLFLAVAAASAPGVTADDPKKSAAVDMVLKMMQKTADKVVAEGETEAKTYFKFETFCSDTEDEKNSAIKENGNEKASLEADIKKWTSDKTVLGKTISTLQTEIPELETQIKDDAAARANESAAYKKSNGEVEAAVTNLDKAVDEMKASKTSFIQKQSVRKTVKAAALLASNLGLKTAKAVDIDAAEDSYSSYDGVIDMLEELHTQFRTNDQTADMAEAKAEASFKMAQQALKNQVAAKKKELADAQQEKADRESSIAQASQDVASTKATIEDDQKYLAELKEMCAEKALTFKQRKAMREEELEAIGQAETILKDAMAPKEAAKTNAVGGDAAGGKQADGAMLLEMATANPHNPQLLAAAEAEAQAIEHEGEPPALGFLQRREEHKPKLQTLAADEAPMMTPQRKQLIALLSKSAEKLHSKKLSALALKAREDPFKMVKDLISGMVSKLQKQASESQSKKAYCDKEIGEAEMMRDEADGKVTLINRKLAKNQARRDQLVEELTVLDASVVALNKQQAEADELRAKEAEESEDEVAEAEEALSGVKQATQVLKDVYAKGKDAKIGLVQQKPAGDAPDAGFDNKEAYTGSQASSGGILGMLEVIQGDFQRSISESKELEAEAIKEHRKLSDSIAVSKSEKEKAVQVKGQFKTETLDEISQQESGLSREISSLKSALVELGALEEECGIGASYEERKAAREEEMATLQEAIDIFNKMIGVAA